MREFTHSLVESESQIQTILHNTAVVSAQFPGLITTSSHAIHAINEETLPTLNQAMINLQEMTQNMVSVTHALKQNPAVLIRGKTPEPLGPGEK